MKKLLAALAHVCNALDYIWPDDAAAFRFFTMLERQNARCMLR
jgi:hypothetical protein